MDARLKSPYKLWMALTTVVFVSAAGWMGWSVVVEEQLILTQDVNLAQEGDRSNRLMAAYTKWAYWLNFAAVFLSGAGLYALLVSLQQTRHAVAAAVEANELAKAQSFLDSRPWLVVDKVRFLGFDRPWFEKELRLNASALPIAIDIEISIRNLGRLPAQDVRISGEWKFGSYWKNPREVNVEKRQRSLEDKYVIGPGDVLVTKEQIFGRIRTADPSQVIVSWNILLDVEYRDINSEHFFNTGWSGALEGWNSQTRAGLLEFGLPHTIGLIDHASIDSMT
ncbi:hypothetical protein I6F15_22845 [Bradyrhizobium sp. BRP14]|nr:hypothetical protein [Bradyrhizobium sp. BRP14]